jgi:hypothetical protein
LAAGGYAFHFGGTIPYDIDGSDIVESYYDTNGFEHGFL